MQNGFKENPLNGIFSIIITMKTMHEENENHAWRRQFSIYLFYLPKGPQVRPLVGWMVDCLVSWLVGLLLGLLVVIFLKAGQLHFNASIGELVYARPYIQILNLN